jgi:hypothetical protein
MRISSDVPREKETVGTKLLHRAECAVAAAIQHDSWDLDHEARRCCGAHIVSGRTDSITKSPASLGFLRRQILSVPRNLNNSGAPSSFFLEASEKRILCIRDVKRLHKYLQSIYGRIIIYGPQIRFLSTDFHRLRKTSKVPYLVIALRASDVDWTSNGKSVSATCPSRTQFFSRKALSLVVWYRQSIRLKACGGAIE